MRGRGAAVAVTLAAGAALAGFQPFGAPWWAGHDYDSVYVSSALTLFRGDRTSFHDHPGTPLQEALAATFTTAWAVSGTPGSRAERSDAYLRDLDSARPYLRSWGLALHLGSAALLALLMASLFGGALWGALGGLLFLAAPDVIAWESVVKPDPVLAALSVAVAFLLVRWVERRRPESLLAAAFLIGLTVTVKIHGVGLLAPLALGVALARPEPGWGNAVREYVRRRQRRLVAAGVAWAVLVVLFNAGSAAPVWSHARDLAAGIAVVVALGGAVAYALRRTRAGALAAAAVACGLAALAGVVLPNLLYASAPPDTVRWLGLALAGRGVGADTAAFSGSYSGLLPWLPLVALGLAGAYRGLRAGERTALIWLCTAAAMGLLAAARYTELRYYAPALVLLVPLALRALQGTPAWVAAGAAAAVLVAPYAKGVDDALDRGRSAERIEATNDWVEARLRPGEVALTQEESSDGRFFYLIRTYASGPEPDYRFLTAHSTGLAWAREHGRRVRFLITFRGANPERVFQDVGLPGRPLPAGRPDVYEVSGA